MQYLPSKTELTAVILEVLQGNSPMSTTDMNSAVIKKLGIPPVLLEIEDANCTGSEFSYRMRWARTELKQKGKIRNLERGIWAIVE